MNEEGVNQTYAYEGTTCGPTYDASTSPTTKDDDDGLPVGGKQDPPKPSKPQDLDTDEPQIIDRKNDR